MAGNANSGRKPVLTPEVSEKILVILRAGNYRIAACHFAGIGESTLAHWMMEGKRDPDSPLGIFRKQVLKAEQDAEIEAVRRVEQHARNDGYLALKYLGIKFPSRWGSQAQVIKMLASRIAVLEAERQHANNGAAGSTAPFETNGTKRNGFH